MFDPALSPARPSSDKPTGEKPRMNISPLDLRQQRFRVGFRGFDRVEVASFLAAVADDYEQSLRETSTMNPSRWRHEVVTIVRRLRRLADDQVSVRHRVNDTNQIVNQTRIRTIQLGHQHFKMPGKPKIVVAQIRDIAAT